MAMLLHSQTHKLLSKVSNPLNSFENILVFQDLIKIIKKISLEIKDLINKFRFYMSLII